MEHSRPRLSKTRRRRVHPSQTDYYAEMTGTPTAHIGVIGDYTPAYPSHPATNDALAAAARDLGATVDVTWVPTADVASPEAARTLDRFDGLWASSGSPYKSLEGALEGIRFARESGKPLVAT